MAGPHPDQALENEESEEGPSGNVSLIEQAMEDSELTLLWEINDVLNYRELK